MKLRFSYNINIDYILHLKHILNFYIYVSKF